MEALLRLTMLDVQGDILMPHRLVVQLARFRGFNDNLRANRMWHSLFRV